MGFFFITWAFVWSSDWFLEGNWRFPFSSSQIEVILQQGVQIKSKAGRGKICCRLLFDMSHYPHSCHRYPTGLESGSVWPTIVASHERPVSVGPENLGPLYLPELCKLKWLLQTQYGWASLKKMCTEEMWMPKWSLPSPSPPPTPLPLPQATPTFLVPPSLIIWCGWCGCLFSQWMGEGWWEVKEWLWGQTSSSLSSACLSSLPWVLPCSEQVALGSLRTAFLSPGLAPLGPHQPQTLGWAGTLCQYETTFLAPNGVILSCVWTPGEETCL